MESLSSGKIIKFNNNTLEVVRKMFGLDKPGEMKQAVDILDEWVKQQNHFTKKDFDKRFLETTIIVSKGSIERAKARLDKGCTLRTMMPHIFQIHDVKRQYETDLKHINVAVLPNMTKNHERVTILKNSGHKFSSTLLDQFVRSIPMYCEYVRLYDYAASNYLVLDYFDVDLTELVKVFKFSAVQEIVAILLDCCGFRLKACYFISSSRTVEIIIAIFKQILSPKLGERIHVLKDRDALKSVIDVDVLPQEYGGKESSVKELHDQLLEEITSEKHLQYLREMNSARTDESLREADMLISQYMGMPGTFRTITVD